MESRRGVSSTRHVNLGGVVSFGGVMRLDQRFSVRIDAQQYLFSSPSTDPYAPHFGASSPHSRGRGLRHDFVFSRASRGGAADRDPPRDPGDAASFAGACAPAPSGTPSSADNTPEDMALYLASNYGPAMQAAELRNEGIVTLVAEAGTRLPATRSCARDRRPIVSPGGARSSSGGSTWTARGTAGGWRRSSWTSSLEAAAERGAGTIWLAVWERNDRAQAFYRKCGFEVVGDKEFLLGTDRQTDRVMARTV